MKAATFFALIAGLVLSACAPVDNSPAPAPESNVLITLERSVCYGFCPSYTVSINGDGGVTYVGRRFVGTTGEQHAQIETADVARLLQRFEQARFSSLRDEYRANVSDLPSTTITLVRGASRKSVLDYGGPMAGMPAAVRELEEEIDRVAGTARWVQGADGQPVREEK